MHTSFTYTIRVHDFNLNSITVIIRKIMNYPRNLVKYILINNN